MKEEIEILRSKLNKLAEESSCLYSDSIIKLSQELDNLIYTYYSNIKSA
jgi:Spo0E like sporulation regulatory protein.